MPGRMRTNEDGGTTMENEKKNAARFLKREWEKLSEQEKKVIEMFTKRSHVSRNVHAEARGYRTLGERVADSVAAFGGSWTFIFIFVGVLVAWVVLNSLILLGNAFDPFPYILLNLFLSMIAALQAPVIMMSQNRQAAIDRLNAEHDYEINLKAELEIAAVREKIDELHEAKWNELIALQREQLELLRRLAGDDVLK